MRHSVLPPLMAIVFSVVNLSLSGCSDGGVTDHRGPRIYAATDESTHGAGGTGSGSTDSGTGGNPGTASGSTTANGSGSGTGANTGIDLMAGLGDPNASGNGGPVALHPEIAEICDGIDNNADGLIDNLDVGHDGICDCLKIATLGVRNPRGAGDVFATWLSSRSVNGAIDLNNTVLTPQLLADFQVVVAQNVSTIGRMYAPSEVTALNDWIQAGGGFMTMTGYAPSPDEILNVNSLLAPMGMSYGPQQILQTQSVSTVPVTMWQAHAVTAGITRIGADNGYPVLGKGQTLASEGGFDMLKAQEVGKGHVLMWGDEWITFNSEWVDHKDYQVEAFWLNMIKWLTPAKECQVPIPAIVIK